jgi:uncharacterized caspase-like protein
MLQRAVGLLCLIAFMSLANADARAERRVALVIGNANYVFANTLRNPANDARAVGEELKKLGFEVVVGTDVDQQDFARKIDEFGRRLQSADVGLFYYAGHGLQMNGKNYLVSTKAKLENEFLVPAETVELDTIIQLMESRARVNLVFLDACRNNPLADRLRQSLVAENRSIMLGRGLARIEPTGHDTLIAYAAAPGQEAADGRGRNSPFTTALLKHMPEPGVEVSVMLKQVAAEVRRDTHNAQRPQQLSDMSRAFYFAKAEAAVVKPAPSPQKATEPKPDHSIELAYWNSAQSANDCDSYRAYLDRFPKGIFVELARLSEVRLCAPTRKVTVTDAATDKSESPSGPVALPRPAAATQVKTASLPPQPEPDLKPTVDKSAGHTDLARELQRELARVGCAIGHPDGVWGTHSRDALRAFSRNARVRLAADDPSQKALEAVRKHHSRVCPAEAGRPRRERDTDRNRERDTGRRRETPARTTVRAERASRPAAGDWHSISPECTSAAFIGGRMCCYADHEFGPPQTICR